MTAALSFMNMLVDARAEEASQRRQAGLAQAQAERERTIAAQRAQDYRKRQDALRAGQRARQAASGVALAGSPLLADDAAENEAALGEARILAGGADRAGQREADAAFARSRAAAALPRGLLRYGSTLLNDSNGKSFWSY